MISYDGLWKVMKERGISQYALINQYGISPAQLTRLRHNEGVNTHTIDMFCRKRNNLYCIDNESFGGVAHLFAIKTGD